VAVGGHVGGWYEVSEMSRDDGWEGCLLMNIHWGSLLALRSAWNMVVFLILARRSGLVAMEL
jgi:hypothetical protein